MAAAKFKTKAASWLEVTLDEAIDFLEANGTDADRKEFKQWLFTTKTGKICKKANWGNARRRFLEKYYPEFLPVAKEKKPNKSDRIANW